MAGAVSERIAWTVAGLAVGPADRLLEIGCGRGSAVALVWPRLTDGTITAIDRSTTAVRQAERRNADAVAAGRAVFHAVPLEQAELGEAAFDTIFAINVNLFWVRESAADLRRVLRALAPTGSLHLCYEPPAAERATMIAARVVPFLAAHGFRATTVTGTTRRGTTLLRLHATPARGSSGSGTLRA